MIKYPITAMRYTLIILLIASFSLLIVYRDTGYGAIGGPPLYVPGEVLIKFKPDVFPYEIDRIMQELRLIPLYQFRNINVEHVRIGSDLTVSEVINLLDGSGLVEYAEPNEDDGSKPVVLAESDQLRSDQIFQEIGAILRERRESLHLSVADIERFTRLRAYYVQALEQAKVDDLPSLVQGRGMLTNYAEFLDLDSEGLMLKFADALQTRRLELAAPQASAAKKRASTPLTKSRGGKPPSWRRFLTLDLVLGGGLFLVLIVFVLWGAGRVINLQREDAQPTLASISDILMTPNADLVTPTADMTASVTPMAAVANTQAPPVVAENTAEATELVVPTLGSAPISVYIVASQRAWMRVTVDTTIVFEGRTIPGNAYPFTGRESIELLTGNGAALQVIYNENDLGTLGTTGEVVDIAFTRDGTVVPTTQPTVTPTPTTQPSATLQPTLPQITPSITPYVP